MTLQDCFDNPVLPVAVGEGWKVGLLSTWILPMANEIVDIQEEVLQAVRIPFRVSARIVSVFAHAFIKQGGIFDDDLVWTIAVAHPQLIRVFLIPSNRFSAPVNLKPLMILPSRTHLRDSYHTHRAVLEPQHDNTGVFGVD